MAESIVINIGNLCDAAVADAFDRKLQEILAKIADANAAGAPKREIVLRLALQRKGDRMEAQARFSCEAAPPTVE
jgi:hypothetical protein